MNKTQKFLIAGIIGLIVGALIQLVLPILQTGAILFIIDIVIAFTLAFWMDTQRDAILISETFYIFLSVSNVIIGTMILVSAGTISLSNLSVAFVLGLLISILVALILGSIIGIVAFYIKKIFVKK